MGEPKVRHYRSTELQVVIQYKTSQSERGTSQKLTRARDHPNREHKPQETYLRQGGKGSRLRNRQNGNDSKRKQGSQSHKTAAGGRSTSTTTGLKGRHGPTRKEDVFLGLSRALHHRFGFIAFIGFILFLCLLALAQGRGPRETRRRLTV